MGSNPGVFGDGKGRLVDGGNSCNLGELHQHPKHRARELPTKSHDVASSNHVICIIALSKFHASGNKAVKR